MNAEQERVLRGWLGARDPGVAPARLRSAVAEVPITTSRAVYPAFEMAMTRLFGPAAAARRVLLLVVILALILAIVAAGLSLRSQPPFPPRGLIAFATPDGMDVRIVNAEGTVNQPVTSTPLVLEHAPRWSPDGGTLLFVRYSGAIDACTGEGSIALYEMVTQRERTIAPGARPIVAAEWSPNGSEIAFLRRQPDCSSLEQSVVDVASGRATIAPTVYPVPPSPTTRTYNPWLLRWTNGLPSTVDFVGAEVESPDGRYVVTLEEPTREAFGHVTIRDRDTSASVDLGAGSQPVWSPDGSALAFVQPIDGPPEYDIQYRDRLVVAATESWQTRGVADIVDPALSPGLPEPILPVSWTGRPGDLLAGYSGRSRRRSRERPDDRPAQGGHRLQRSPMAAAARPSLTSRRVSRFEHLYEIGARLLSSRRWQRTTFPTSWRPICTTPTSSSRARSGRAASMNTSASARSRPTSRSC
jgi:Tol biopolymer transport system component